MPRKVGEIIKKKRQSRKMSLEDLCHEADVTRGSIQSLEKLEYEDLPADIYVKSILKRVANVLKMNGDVLYKHYLFEDLW